MENRETDKFAWMSKSQYLNYLAIELLETMGNTAPTQAEIDFVENLLARLGRRYQKYCAQTVAAATLR